MQGQRAQLFLPARENSAHACDSELSVGSRARTAIDLDQEKTACARAFSVLAPALLECMPNGISKEGYRMKRWFMLTVVGNDRPGIVARLADVLFRGGCNLGEASMARLGGNFSIMLMVETDHDLARLRALAEPAARELGLHLHLDEIQAHLHDHPEPNARVTVYGADRAGIVADVTAALARAGCNILDLNSDVGGSEQAPIYVMIVDVYTSQGIEAIEAALAGVRNAGIDVKLTAIDTLIG